MDKTMTICFTNNKGGSGKSTTCSNVGAAMAMAGKKVLLVDGDMQLNLSLSFWQPGKRTSTMPLENSRISRILSCPQPIRTWI